MRDNLLALIRRFEGCRLLAYLCPARVWTIGWGSTGPGITKGVRWTQVEANLRLEKDAEGYAMAVMKISPKLGSYPLLWAAIADFAYNLGIARYAGSTLRKRVDAMDWQGITTELPKWVYGGGQKLPGLILRRAAEVDLANRANDVSVKQ